MPIYSLAQRGGARLPMRQSSFFSSPPHQGNKEGRREHDCDDCNSQYIHGHLPSLAGDSGILGIMATNDFGRCDGHHRMVDLRAHKRWGAGKKKPKGAPLDG